MGYDFLKDFQGTPNFLEETVSRIEIVKKFKNKEQATVAAAKKKEESTAKKPQQSAPRGRGGYGGGRGGHGGYNPYSRPPPQATPVGDKICFRCGNPWHPNLACPPAKK
jgi:hypothetical protein